MLALVPAVATAGGAADFSRFPSVSLLPFTAAMQRYLPTGKVSPLYRKSNKCSTVMELNVDGIKVARCSRPPQRCKQSVCKVS